MTNPVVPTNPVVCAASPEPPAGSPLPDPPPSPGPSGQRLTGTGLRRSARRAAAVMAVPVGAWAFAAQVVGLERNPVNLSTAAALTLLGWALLTAAHWVLTRH